MTTPTENTNYAVVLPIALLAEAVSPFDFNTRVTALTDVDQVAVLEFLDELEHGIADDDPDATFESVAQPILDLTDTSWLNEPTAEVDDGSKLSIDEKQLIADFRKLGDLNKETQRVAWRLVAQLVEEAEHSTDLETLSTAYVATKSAPQSTVESEPQPEAKQFVQWGNMDLMNYEPGAATYIPHAIQTVGLMLAECLLSTDDKAMWGDDWSECFSGAIHIIAHAMARASHDSPVTELADWGK